LRASKQGYRRSKKHLGIKAFKQAKYEAGASQKGK